jgi:hypothetical protein
MAKAKQTKAEKVAAYMQQLQHPMKDVIEELRKVIKASHTDIEEDIAWNTPTYYYTGLMQDFAPKEYKNYIVGFVMNRTDCVRLVFLFGKRLDNADGLLEGTFKDERKLAVFNSMQDVKNKKQALQAAIRNWIATAV